jgi:hypothetical protein
MLSYVYDNIYQLLPNSPISSQNSTGDSGYLYKMIKNKGKDEHINTNYKVFIYQRIVRKEILLPELEVTMFQQVIHKFRHVGIIFSVTICIIRQENDYWEEKVFFSLYCFYILLFSIFIYHNFNFLPLTYSYFR